MKLRTGILVLGLMLGTAWAQNPDIIQNTRQTLQNVQTKQTNDQNAALTAAGQSAKPAPSKPAAGNPAPQSKPAVEAAFPVAVPKAAASEKKPATPAAKPAVTKPADSPKAAAKKAAPKKQATTVVAVNPPAKKPVAVEDKKVPEESKKKEPKEYSAAGRRDPFISPVVSHTASGSGCNSGKRCLAVDQIILTGVVKSETGMIAVVVNSMNKAYFLRENDPVFNGYVVKITGDSVIFNQTIQDKLGKPFTREVTKKILTPAV
jgi:Tfp pilus assembly protein PilP